ncbi:MAG: division/cell wall cluster transcriptional repressor MraZ, partial [Chloroflexota bacterium]|nr:division/cell wall cluster transcriptional repressor MraZ [Chloroflexota bacterium]
GRFAIPARYRLLFAEGAVVTRGFEKCLILYPAPEWEAWAEKVSSLPSTQGEARQLQRLVFSGAADCEPDSLGRINVPAYLRDYAALDTEVTLVGLGNRMEIWNRQKWNGIRSTVEERGEDIAAQLERFGI